jgi:hypothetical protein
VIPTDKFDPCFKCTKTNVLMYIIIGQHIELEYLTTVPDLLLETGLNSVAKSPDQPSALEKICESKVLNFSLRSR